MPEFAVKLTAGDIELLQRACYALVAREAMGAVLIACAPSLTEQVRLEQARAETAQARAAVVRAEGDAAVLKAQAYDLTTRAQGQASFQDMQNKLIWLQQAESTIIDNTFFACCLLGLLVVLIALDICLHVLAITGYRVKPARG